MKNNHIRNLAELDARKKEVKQEMELSREEFTKSIANMKTDARNFLIKGVAVPTGLAGLALLGVNKAVDAAIINSSVSVTDLEEIPVKSKTGKVKKMKGKVEVASTSDFTRWAPILIQLAKSTFSYIMEKQEEDEKDARTYSDDQIVSVKKRVFVQK